MARAHGKVILLGEHVVVHGVPALAVGIARGVEAHARPTAGVSTLAIDAGPAVRADEPGDLARALRAVLDYPQKDGSIDLAAPARAPLAPLAIEARSELPPGAGLGCSAALGVAIARAVSEARGERLTAGAEHERALAWEEVFHGNPSGVDTAVSAQGGCVLFTRGTPPTITPVHVRRPLHLAIGHSGTASSTRVMVEGVAHFKARSPEVFGKTLEGVRSLVQNARLCLESGDLAGLGKLMDLNQMLLSGLMLSTSEIETLCASARDAGALGAKLTGAGGGGCVVALCEDDAGPIVAAWESLGFVAFASTVAASP
jgi:mevalonate kinase